MLVWFVKSHRKAVCCAPAMPISWFRHQNVRLAWCTDSSSDRLVQDHRASLGPTSSHSIAWSNIITQHRDRNRSRCAHTISISNPPPTMSRLPTSLQTEPSARTHRRSAIRARESKKGPALLWESALLF
eukprot:1781269-Rhodomonas_salina.7